MTSKKNPMPGGMDESPHKGESSSKQTRIKPSFTYKPAETESMSDSALGGKWSENKVSDSHTCSIRKDPRSSKDAWKPPGSLERTASSESKRKASGMTRTRSDDVGGSLDRSKEDGDRQSKGLDRLGNTSGDRPSGNLDRPVESGGDRFKEEGGEEEEEDDDEEDEPDPGGRPLDEVPTGNEPIAGSTPVEIPSNRSETKIESDLLEKEESPRGSNSSKKSRLTLPDPKEWAEATELAGRMEVKPNPNPEPSLPDVNLDVPIEAVKGPVKTRTPKKEPLKWKRAPPRPAEERRKFITEKTRILKGNGDDPFNYEPEFALVPKHSNGSNHWSDKDLRTLKNNMRKFEDSEGYMLKDSTLEGVKEILRDHEWDIKMPHKPHSPKPTGYETTLEYADDEDERKDEKVVTVAVISVNNDEKSDPLFIQHQHDGYDDYREALWSEILAS